ncbi:hypothetical protein [uncultured Psychrobacter sp.]|uniref:hypothetical protein n=1 Tax=uncultured Psychrobacter sp. TaxID=259303 RepID=UPI0030DB3780
MSSTQTPTKTKLFNDDLREVVELSMSAEEVDAIKGVRYSDTLKLPVIDEDTFSELRDNFGNKYRDYQEISSEHFVDTCTNLDSESNESKKDYAAIYGELVEQGFDIEQIFRKIPELLTSTKH